MLSCDLAYSSHANSANTNFIVLIQSCNEWLLRMTYCYPHLSKLERCWSVSKFTWFVMCKTFKALSHVPFSRLHTVEHFHLRRHYSHCPPAEACDTKAIGYNTTRPGLVITVRRQTTGIRRRGHSCCCITVAIVCLCQPRFDIYSFEDAKTKRYRFQVSTSCYRLVPDTGTMTYLVSGL